MTRERRDELLLKTKEWTVHRLADALDEAKALKRVLYLLDEDDLINVNGDARLVLEYVKD